MDKLQMAHEFAIMRMGKATANDYQDGVALAWQYADAMQAEWDSRISKDLPDVFKKDKEGNCLHKHTTYGGGECFDCGNVLNSTNSSQLEYTRLNPKGVELNYRDTLSPEVTHLSNTLAVQNVVYDDEFQFTGYETPTDEWQPDWSQAPSLATHWSMTDYGTAK